MAEAFIVGAVRTPVGRRNGGLSAVHPVDLAAHVLTELVARTGADPGAVDDVIMGCVSQIGPQSIDIAVSYTHLDVYKRQGASIASALCTSTRMSPECTGIGYGSAGGRPGAKSLSTSSPHTCP